MTAQRGTRRGLRASVAMFGALSAFGVQPSSTWASPSHGDGPSPAGVQLPPVPDKQGASASQGEAFDRSPVTRVRTGRLRTARAEAGTLRGKTIYLSAGHGYYYGDGA